MRNVFLLLGCITAFYAASAQTFDCDSIGVRGPLEFYTISNSPEICPGESFCLEFGANNYDSVLGFQFTLTFDPSKILFVSAEQDPIALRGTINFGVDDVSNGQLEVLWTDELMLSQSLNDSTAVFTLCFVTIGEGLDDINMFINSALHPTYPRAGVAYQPSQMVGCLSDYISLNEDNGINFSLCCDEFSINQLEQCSGDENELSFSVCGGASPYMISILDDQGNEQESATVSSDGDSVNFSTLQNGSYSINATDANGDMVDASISFMPSDSIQYGVAIGDPLCHYTRDGSVRITNVTGGTGPYAVYSNTGLYFTQQSEYEFENLINGQYGFTIEDDLGCKEEFEVTFDTPELELTIDVDPPTCITFEDGFVTVTAQGGTPFPSNTYMINGVISQSFETSNPLNHPLYNDQDGLFSITVEDANGCAVTEFFEIPLVTTPGDACDDGDPETENDMVQSDCTCAGTPIPGLRYLGDTELFLPEDIVITVPNCLTGYSFPSGLFEDPQTGRQYPFPLIENTHYEGLTNIRFTASHSPFDTFEEGTTNVFYVITNDLGDELLHTFNVLIICEQNCDANFFCASCSDVVSGGCFSCGIDDLLNGFSSCTPEWNGNAIQAGQPNPLCNGQGAPQNMSWFSFVAGSETLDIIVTPSNCIEGANGNIGIEIGLYDDCQGSCIEGDTDCGQVATKVLSTTNLIIGQTYYLFLDGCDGSACEYEININNSNNFSISAPSEIRFVSSNPSCQILGNDFCDECEIMATPFHDGSAAYEDAGFYSEDLDLVFEWIIDPPLNGESMITASITEDGYIFPPIFDPPEDVYAICLFSVTNSCDSWNGIICTELYLRDCSDFDNDMDGYPFSEDCNDDDVFVNPGAEEICDGQDNNCDGVIDEGFTDTYYFDNDGDGYGDPNNSIITCEPEANMILNNEDCNDNSNISFPGAEEICDGLDNNCDGEVDEGTQTETYYADNDLDGFGDPMETFEGCFRPFGFVDNADDCNDMDVMINPNAIEDCDGVDNNCDGQIDEGLNAVTYFIDGDMDGFGDPDNFVVACDQPPGTTLDGTDCDDMNSNAYPGAPEVLGNGIDENCDGRDNTTNTDDQEISKVRIYPNPTESIVQISGIEFSKAIFYDVSGREVKRTSEALVNMEELDQGIYMIRLVDSKNKLLHVSTVVKQ